MSAVLTRRGEAAATARRLADAGFIAAGLEARHLITAADGDPATVEELVERRLAGEPLAWIVGWTSFCGISIGVGRGVYVPRPHSEHLARRAVRLLPPRGRAIELCAGSGALARVLIERRRAEVVVGTDIDEAAVACARSNGVDAHLGDLFEPVPDSLRNSVDLVVGVVPYVPTGELGLLQRDTFGHESTLAYDGGPDGARLLRRAIAAAPVFLRRGGWLVLELGGEQAGLLAAALAAAGFDVAERIRDEEGQTRGVAARLDG